MLVCITALAGVAWEVSSKAAGAVGGSEFGEMLGNAAQRVRSGVDEVEEALRSNEERLNRSG